MLTKARIEAEIAALATEVNEVARRRGRSLPTPNDLADLLMALGVTLEAMASAREPGEDQDRRLAAIFTPGEVAPAAAALREGYLTLIGPALIADRPAYFRALRALRPVLANLLERRAEQWSERWVTASRPSDFYRGTGSPQGQFSVPPAFPARPDQTPADWAAQAVARAKGWHRVLLAGLALNVAATELREWRDWIAGEAMKQYDALLRERANPAPSSTEDPAARWARDVAKHTLPDEEEVELLHRGVVTAEELAAVKALPPISPGPE